MENIFTASKPFIYLSKFVGMFPVSLGGAARKQFLKAEWINTVISFFILVTLICILWAHVEIIDMLFLGQSRVLISAWSVLTNLEISLFLILFCYQIYSRKNILKFLLMIEDIDDKVICYLN